MHCTRLPQKKKRKKHHGMAHGENQKEKMETEPFPL
jgi:hypothetical protein